MKQIYYQDIDFKEGQFGMTKDDNVFIVATHKTKNCYIAVYEMGGYDYMEHIFFDKKIKYIETTPSYNSFNNFKYAIEDSIKGEITGVSEVVYTRKRNDGTLEMLKKWRKEIEEEISKREKQ